MSTLFLSAVCGTRGKCSIALATNLFFTSIRCSNNFHRRFNNTTTKTKNQVKGTFLLNVIVRKSAFVFQLLTGKNQALLVRWNTFLVLDFGLDSGNGVSRLDVQGNSLTSECFNKDLHFLL